MYTAERQRIESLVPFGRILDVGCGLGLFLEQFPSDRWDRYGIDVADLAIAEARSRGIHVQDGDRAYDYPDRFFDVIVLRGSLQLIPTPFAVLRDCIRLLKPGGLLALLATPNSNSPYYRRFGTLPILTPHLNYLVPSDIMMRDVLRNLGMEIVRIHYPYLDTPYARPFIDHMWYLLSFLGVRRRFAFWRSTMELYARKPHPTDHA